MIGGDLGLGGSRHWTVLALRSFVWTDSSAQLTPETFLKVKLLALVKLMCCVDVDDGGGFLMYLKFIERLAS